MSSKWGELEWIALFVFIIGTFWQPFPVKYDYYKKIEEERKKFWWLPGRRVYGIVWFFIYTMIVTGIFVFWNYESGNFDSNNVLIVFTLFIANMFFNKIWPWLFFGIRQIGLAFFDALAIWATAIVIAVFAAIEAVNHNSVIWVTFAMFVPYIAWVTIAASINLRWWYIKPKEKRTRSSEPGI